MIMDSMKKMTTDRAKTSYNGIPYWFKRSIINTQLLPEYADKWINYLTNPELEECFINASINVYGDNFMEMVEEIGQGDVWLLFCGEFFDCIKDKVIEKQAYLKEQFDFKIADEEIESEVEDYLKRNKWLM
jgi:hypothetical protein